MHRNVLKVVMILSRIIESSRRLLRTFVKDFQSLKKSFYLHKNLFISYIQNPNIFNETYRQVSLYLNKFCNYRKIRVRTYKVDLLIIESVYTKTFFYKYIYSKISLHLSIINIKQTRVVVKRSAVDICKQLMKFH